jgi:DNA-directed RNA polymerase subunit RPC12/RpoP
VSNSQLDLPGGEDEGPKGDEKRRKDFDCPECNANNPYDEGISPGDEVRCYYCGLEFKVVLTDEGKWRFREI